MALAMETGPFAVHQMTKLLERLVFQIRGVRHSHEAEAVHDLRVAIRRFTQALVVYQPCFDPKEVKKIRRRLKDTMALAGQVRDYDIALKYLSDWRSPEVAALREEFQIRRHEANRVLAASLKRWVLRKTSSKWRDALEAVREADGFCHRQIHDTARRELPRIARGYLKCGNRAADAGASAEELHQFRIAAKKLRYTIELFAQVYGPTADGWVERIAGVQSLLGRINDCRTVRIMVSRTGGNARIEAFLKSRQRRRTEEFRRFWADEFSGAAKQWMHALRCPPKKPVARSTATNQNPPRAAGVG